MLALCQRMDTVDVPCGGAMPQVGGMPNVGAMPKDGHCRCAMWRRYAAGLSEFDIGAQRRQLIVIVGLRR
jgi:hypothetical protein